MTVRDTQALVFADVPAIIQAVAGSGGTANVSWTAPTATDNSGVTPMITASAALGDALPLGRTNVS